MVISATETIDDIARSVLAARGAYQKSVGAPFLPDEYYLNKKAPLRSTPNSSYVNYRYNDYTRQYEKSTAYYDYAGRQCVRIDWTNHGYSTHGNPHIHYRAYSAQYPDGKRIRWD